MIKDNKLKIAIAVFALLLFVIMFNLVIGQTLHSFELRTLDLRLKLLAKEEHHDPNIVQLLLDDHSTSIATNNPELGLGRIPWPRKAWGEVIEFLNRTQPKAIVFDINYIGSEGSYSENIASDEYFTNAVKKSKAKVFFGVLFTDSIDVIKSQGSISQEILDNAIQKRLLLIPSAIRQLLYKKSIVVESFLRENSPMKDQITYTVYSPIMEGLLRECSGIGTINLKSDEDGVNRKHMPLFIYNGNFYPSLSLVVAKSLLSKGENKLELYDDYLKLGSRKIPLDNEGKNFTTWYGDPKTYTVYHVIDAITSERALKKGVKQGGPITLDPSVFKDKIIIIGQTASGTDIHNTPLLNKFVGTAIVATNIDNLLNQKVFINQLNPYLTYSLAFLFILLMWFTVTKSESTPILVASSILIIFTYVLISVLSLTVLKIWLELVMPTALLILTFVVGYITKYMFTSKKLENAIEQATKDGLTKLYNHRFFQEKIHQDLANASRQDDRVSLCLIDIDFFKKFNDTYGHRAGDAVLIQVAQTLKDSVRKNDLVARYGGEEMCVLLDKSDVDQALLVAQKLVDNIAQKEFWIDEGKKKVSVTISVGVATFPTHAKNVPDLIEFSDKGLYRAKEGGRNQVGALEDIILEEPKPGERQIKEVEIQKAKLIKAIEDFKRISNEKEYDYEPYFFDLIKEKEVFSNEFLKNIDLKDTNIDPE